MPSIRLIFPVVFCFVFLLSSCGPDIIYEKNYDLPEEGWSYEDALNFEVPVEDTLEIYNLYLDLVHSRDYPFENMYVRIHTTFPSGRRTTEQVSLELAGEAGIWNGDCGREICRITIPIQTNAYFDQTGSYEFTLEQYMRRNPLPGVESIAFRMEDTGNRRTPGSQEGME
jgi:gliding motility-associated lipoprotein GldH